MENIEPEKKNSDIIILVNGPGELASYVRPTLEALHRRPTRPRITIVFSPCPYSTGKETQIAKSFPGVSQVINDREFFRWMLIRKLPKGVEFGRSGVVVYMGGDILYGKMIAKRLKYPAIAYSEAYAKWPHVYKAFLVPDKQTFNKFKSQGFPENQIKIVGNLMVDSVRAEKDRETMFKNLRLDPGKRLVSFMPGSRKFQVQYMFHFFSKVAGEIRKLRNDCQFVFIISPYLRHELLQKYAGKADPSILIVTEDQQSAIAASDLVITIPGTNTAEVAVLGTPIISVFPSNNSQMIPFEGIYEMIGKVPVLGYIFKKICVKILLSRTRFFTIPNIKTGMEIVPELKDKVLPRTVADMAAKLLDNPEKLDEMRKQLRSSLGPRGAAENVAREILNETLH